ncbi:hypothetical protein B0H16DRAFT_1737121 [Mycena metata]|uniref:F-box domain-containing protein n=1 Tax=Mycena metata TaxID=1033252 RepID=A0AAD7HLT6_9AGAR|nr:hypothetical protein B0H16DRAFT_1737121 [Mycena metata]
MVQITPDLGPLDDEISQISALIAQPSLRLIILDQELRKLADERERLATYVDSHTALLSPVRRLPLDILQEIFIACLPAHRNCVMSATEAPVLLGRICSSWRNISLSTPCLWSRLHLAHPILKLNPSVPLSAVFTNKVAQRLEIAKTWLGRSGQCPLAISSLWIVRGSIEHPENTTNLLIDTLLPFSSRWEHISFVTAASILPKLSHLTEADVPVWKSFKFRQADAHEEDSPQWNSLRLLRGRTLSCFGIIAKGVMALEMPLRWNNLTGLEIEESFDLDSMTAERALDVLSRCPKLRTCRLQVVYRPGAAITEWRIVECPFLHTFVLQSPMCSRTSLPSAIQQFSDRLSFPHLRHLKLCGKQDDGPAADISYYSFLAAAPHLESVDLNMDLCTKAALKDFLLALPPTLRRFRISKAVYAHPRHSFDDDLLPTFTSACPGLQELEIHDCPSMSDVVLINFIKSNMVAGALRRLVILFERRYGEFKYHHPDVQPFLEVVLWLPRYGNSPGGTPFASKQGLEFTP